MYDLTDLTKWRPIGTAGIDFPTDKPRKVRLELLAADEVTVAVKFDKRSMPIGVFHGYEVISFQMQGPFTLTCDGQCFVWTPELETTGAVEIPDAIPFTTMMNRRERNPQLELLMHKMNQNVERRMRKLEQDMVLPLLEERRLNELERRRVNAERETADQEASLVEPPDEDGGEDEPAEADAGGSDELPKRRAVAGRPPMVKRTPAPR